MKKAVPFVCFFLVIVLMALATFIEKTYGTIVAQEQIYHAPWFVSLWAALAVSALVYMVHRKLWKFPLTAGLHVALLLILVGALVTHLTSLTGTLHLRESFPTQFFPAQQSHFFSNRPVLNQHKLPFTVELDKFVVTYYPGTVAPANYTSEVLVDGKRKAEISMNKILYQDGYRFYQTSFDSDYRGTLLTVNYDPWGTPITYAGYALLTLSMLLMLIDPNATFRKLLRAFSAKKKKVAMVCLAAFLFFPANASAGEAIGASGSSNSKTPLKSLPALQEVTARRFGELQVLYNDRVVPFQTLARDFSMKLCGKTKYRGLTSEQLFTAWLFYPERWQFEPLIPIKNKELAHQLGCEDRTSFLSFFASEGSYKLQSYWDKLHQSGSLSPLQKAITEADERVQLIEMLEKGSFLKLFPLPDAKGKVNWYSPADSLPANIAPGNKLFIRGFFTLFYETVQQGDEARTLLLIDELHRFQKKGAGASLLSPTHVQVELWYNQFGSTTFLYRVNLTFGLLGFFLFLFKHKRRLTEKFSRISKVFYIVLMLCFSYLTILLFMRSYIAGRLPMSNGYETMILLSFFIMAAALVLHRYWKTATIFGFLLSGFTLLVSSIAQMNPQITPLMPVLLSPWLSLHVSLIMMAYALYSFTFLSGLTVLALSKKEQADEIERLTLISRTLLYPATFLLAIGIFVGAVWANVSWGCYWSWDPKEVWALITLMVYSIPLHADSFPKMKQSHAYHIYMIAAFLILLMTYFGVNYVLGGMHSYA